MSAELDMSQYLDLFLQEANEQLEILEQETLKLETEPSMERLQSIFRAAHTIKGSSRAMGFQHFAELTHEIENLLDQLRNQVVAVSTPVTDALLQGIDTLKQMSEDISAGKGDAIECGPLVAVLARLSSGEGETGSGESSGLSSLDLSQEQRESLRLAMTTGTLYHGVFHISPECVMKYVRAFMVVSAIQGVGEIVMSLPSEDDLEAEKFQSRFDIFFQSHEDIEELTQQLKKISEITSATVTPYEEPQEKQEATLATAGTTAPGVAADKAAEKKEAHQTVRVDVARLDQLMNLVGELVIDRTRIAQIGSELSNKFSDANIDALSETVSHIARITSDLQEQIMKARMLPIETVFNRFPRVVRDLAQKLGKDVKLEMIGGETELDRSVIEVIGDPLLHILRNCVDHGIEEPKDRAKVGKPTQGHIVVSAKHQESYMVIEIRDDGKGIDVDRVKAKAVSSGLITQEAADRMHDKEALQLIFASGLSTAAQVSEVSGRGVGMDIVRSNINRLGGLIDLESERGKGSKFMLRLPLTLAIIRGLLVDVAKNVYVVPLGNVIETLSVGKEQIQKVNNKPVIVIRGMTTPLIKVSDILATKRRKSKKSLSESYVVIVGLADQRVGLVVDRLIGEQEVVIKSLSRHVGDVSGVSGATILGDGNVAMIMDVNSMLVAS